jgi:hypothetical protein
MKKLFCAILKFSVISSLIFLFSCESHNTALPVAYFSPTAADTTESDIREQKPKFLDFTPITYHLVNTGENNYIRIITNSDDLQKVWMVYYDHNGKKWDTLIWIGRGLNNKIIADTIFNTIYGVVNRSGHIEDPTFYMAYSKDDGKTWQNHPIEKSALVCKKGLAQLLVSNDFNRDKDQPAIAVMIQSKGLIGDAPKSMEEWNNDYLCSLMVDHTKK